jgi:DNA polymerase-3 subunit epsilon
MIHQLLKLTRPLIIPDVETTGLDTKTDRIIEIGFQVWTAEGLMKEWRSLVNPDTPIPEHITKIHDISDASMQRCQTCGGIHPKESNVLLAQGSNTFCFCETFKSIPTFKQLAPSLARGFTNCDYAGKNVRFDLQMLSSEFARAGIKWDYTDARVICADRLEQIGEPRTLSALYEKHTGKKAQNAHEALADVRMTTELIVSQLLKYKEIPRDLDELHAALWPGWLCDGGQFRMINGVAVCMFGKWRGRPMKDIDSSYWDWILSADFPADVKKLAAEAKMGKFPGTKP